MQQTTNSYKDLSYALSKVKIDFEILGTTQDLRIRSFAVDTFRDMNMYNTLPTVQTRFLEIDRHGVAQFPDDYQQYFKIGLDHCGRILNLRANDAIALTPITECMNRQQSECCLDEFYGAGEIGGVPILPGVTSPQSNWQAGPVGSYLDIGQTWDYLPGFHNGQFVAGFYGLGSGVDRGGYRIDEANRNIRFDFRHFHEEGRPRQVIMEYQSDGGIDSGNAYLPVTAAATLIYGIKLRLCQNSTRKEWVIKTQMWQSLYNSSLRRLVWLQRGFTPIEALQVIRESFKQVPKR